MPEPVTDLAAEQFLSDVAERLPDPEVTPVLKPEVARHFLHLGRSAMYDAINRGEVPSIRIGRLIVIPTAALRRMLQVDDAPDAA